MPLSLPHVLGWAVTLGWVVVCCLVLRPAWSFLRHRHPSKSYFFFTQKVALWGAVAAFALLVLTTRSVGISLLDLAWFWLGSSATALVIYWRTRRTSFFVGGGLRQYAKDSLAERSPYRHERRTTVRDLIGLAPPSPRFVGADLQFPFSRPAAAFYLIPIVSFLCTAYFELWEDDYDLFLFALVMPHVVALVFVLIAIAWPGYVRLSRKSILIKHSVFRTRRIYHKEVESIELFKSPVFSHVAIHLKPGKGPRGMVFDNVCGLKMHEVYDLVTSWHEASRARPKPPEPQPPEPQPPEPT